MNPHDNSCGFGLEIFTFFLSIYTTHKIGRNSINTLLAENTIFEQLISQSGFPLQVTSGHLDLKVESSWNLSDESSETTILVAANNIDGDYAQNQYNSVNSPFEFINQKGWKLIEPTDILIGQINLGMPVEDISIRLDRLEFLDDKQPYIEVSEITASVLDGSMIAQNIELDLNHPINEFSLFLSALSLEKLLALNQTKDLIASGHFDGELPLQINNGEILINDGWIKADEAGGFIKYGKVGEVLVGNDNLVMVGELLKDFRYNEMSAQVNLNSEGGLFLATKLHGRSPTAELNKQVNLNFNIEFNLWKFLESARLLTRIDQDISKQIISNESKK